MATTASVASYDTYIAEQYTTDNYGGKPHLRLSGDSGTGTHRFGFLYFAGMPPRGATIFTATLSLFAENGSQWSGTSNITVKRVTGTWSESKLTWARAGTSQLATGAGSSTVAVTAPVTTGQQIDIDVTSIMSDISSGTAWYGLRVGIDGGGTIRDICSTETTKGHAFRPTLTITWARAPDAPSDLAPSGGLAVSVQKPVLSWKYQDKDGNPQAQYQVQTCLDNTFGTVEFDTGWVVSSTTQVDLSATAYAGLSDGNTRFWRVRVQDSNGLTSSWSAVQSFVRHVKGTLAISNPPNGGFVEETTPPITTTLTGQAQVSVAYGLDVLASDGSWQEVWKVGRFAAAATSGTPFTYSLPAGLLTGAAGTQYRVRVLSYDNVDRVATPGDPTSTNAASQFVFNRSAVPAAVTALTVTPTGPGLTVAFTRATEPDWFALKVDGAYVYDRLAPDIYRTSAPPITNFLTGDNAGFNATLGTWVNQSNATLAQTTSQAQEGAGSLQITCSTAGNAAAVSSATGSTGLTNGLPCAPGDVIYVQGWFKAASTTRTCDVGVKFLDNTGTAIGTASYGSVVTDSASAWTEATASVTAPAGAVVALATGRVHSAALSEVHYFDDVWLSNGVPGSGPVSYAFTWYGAKPNASHTIEVEAVVNDAGVLKHSQGNPTVTLTPYVQGIWFVDDAGSPFASGASVTVVRLDGQESQDFTIGESSNVYYPVGARAPVTVTDSIRGAEGTIAGTVTDDGNGYVAAFRWMKQPEQAGRQLRLIYGTTNIPVALGQAHLTPLPYASEVTYSVSVDVAQVGEFD